MKEHFPVENYYIRSQKLINNIILQLAIVCWVKLKSPVTFRLRSEMDRKCSALMFLVFINWN